MYNKYILNNEDLNDELPVDIIYKKLSLFPDNDGCHVINPFYFDLSYITPKLFTDFSNSLSGYKDIIIRSLEKYKEEEFFIYQKYVYLKSIFNSYCNSIRLEFKNDPMIDDFVTNIL